MIDFFRYFWLLVLTFSTLTGVSNTRAESEAGLLNGREVRQIDRNLLGAISEKSLLQLPQCTQRQLDHSYEEIPVVKKVEGFTSRMRGYPPARGSDEVAEFAVKVSRAATLAYMKQDEEGKARVIKSLARWGNARGMLDTKSCVVDGFISQEEICKEWRVPDGSDLSAMKDATFVTMFMAGMHRTYFLLLKNSNPQLNDEHEAVQRWLGAELKKRLKKPGDVYFGLNVGWYWPSIDQDIASGDIAVAKRKIKKLLEGVEKLILADGSIKERTTRGDRALWYHFSGLQEIIVSIQYAKSVGLDLPPKLETKLHEAVQLFLNGLDDHTYVSKWASVRHHAVYDGKTQDWNDGWMTGGDMNTTWIYAYQYWFPDHPNAKRLAARIPKNSPSATQDVDFGFGLGCLYLNAMLNSEN
jgi:hypothetical protein